MILIVLFFPSVSKADFDPSNPSTSGYQIVFDEEFNSVSTIDVKDTRKPGHKWYTSHFFGAPTTPSSAYSATVEFLTLTQHNSYNGSLGTAGPAKNKQGFVGQAWGGGAYFEASFKFDPAQVNTAKGWPAFWSMAIEHLAQKGLDQWPGQPKGYVHFIEDDFFEYDTASSLSPYTYGAALHDWYGIYKKTCPEGFCGITNPNFKVSPPKGTDFTQIHSYSQLWVPSVNGQKGFINNYFDGQLLNQVTWVTSGDGTPPPSGTFTYSILDKQHLAIMLGTGDQQAMRINRVRVWQIPGQGTCVGDCVKPATTSTSK